MSEGKSITNQEEAIEFLREILRDEITDFHRTAANLKAALELCGCKPLKASEVCSLKGSDGAFMKHYNDVQQIGNFYTHLELIKSQGRSAPAVMVPARVRADDMTMANIQALVQIMSRSGLIPGWTQDVLESRRQGGGVQIGGSSTSGPPRITPEKDPGPIDTVVQEIIDNWD